MNEGPIPLAFFLPFLLPLDLLATAFLAASNAIIGLIPPCGGGGGPIGPDGGGGSIGLPKAMLSSFRYILCKDSLLLH